MSTTSYLDDDNNETPGYENNHLFVDLSTRCLARRHYLALNGHTFYKKESNGSEGRTTLSTHSHLTTYTSLPMTIDQTNPHSGAAHNQLSWWQ